MNADLAVRPVRINREDARIEKQRATLFAGFIKAGAMQVASYFADWFVNVMSRLLWTRGAAVIFEQARNGIAKVCRSKIKPV